MKQREIPLLGDAKRPLRDLPPHLIQQCKNKQQAIQLCVQWSGIQLTALSELLDIDKGNLSRMMTGSAYFPPNKENLLQDICGNDAILQWCCWSRGKKPIAIDPTPEIEALQEQIRQLQAAS